MPHHLQIQTYIHDRYKPTGPASVSVIHSRKLFLRGTWPWRTEDYRLVPAVVGYLADLTVRKAAFVAEEDRYPH